MSRRKKRQQNRSEVIGVALTPKERKELEKLAETWATSLSSLARKLIMDQLHYLKNKDVIVATLEKRQPVEPDVGWTRED